MSIAGTGCSVRGPESSSGVVSIFEGEKDRLELSANSLSSELSWSTLMIHNDMLMITYILLWVVLSPKPALQVAKP